MATEAKLIDVTDLNRRPLLHLLWYSCHRTQRISDFSCEANTDAIADCVWNNYGIDFRKGSATSIIDPTRYDAVNGEGSVLRIVDRVRRATVMALGKTTSPIVALPYSPIVDVTGLDKVKLLASLWYRSPSRSPNPSGCFPPSRELVEEWALEASKKAAYVGFLADRPIKVDFAGVDPEHPHLIDPTAYDRFAGAGTFKKVVDAIIEEMEERNSP